MENQLPYFDMFVEGLSQIPYPTLVVLPYPTPPHSILHQKKQSHSQGLSPYLRRETLGNEVANNSESNTQIIGNCFYNWYFPGRILILTA